MMESTAQAPTESFSMLLQRNQPITIDELVENYKRSTASNVVNKDFKLKLEYYMLYTSGKPLERRKRQFNKNRIPYAEQVRLIYSKVKDASLNLIKTKQVTNKGKLVRTIYDEFGIRLDFDTLKEIFGKGETELQIYSSACRQFASVRVLQSKIGRTLIFQCKENPPPQSLSHGSQLKSHVVIHDGCAGQEYPHHKQPELGEWLSWHSIGHERMETAADCIRFSRWNLEWKEVKVVVLCVGNQLFRECLQKSQQRRYRKIFRKLTASFLTDITEHVKNLAKAVWEKAPEAEIHLWSLPVFSKFTEHSTLAVHLNKKFRKLCKNFEFFHFHNIVDSNENVLANLENWKTDFMLKWSVFQSLLLKFMSEKRK